MSFNDNCANNWLGISEAMLEAQVLQDWAIELAAQSYGTKEECETNRSLATRNFSREGCYFRTTTSPCMGGVISGGASGAADPLAPSQGHSFYTTNPANEIRDWSNDDIERHLALDQKYQSPRPEAIVTTDAKYNEERAAARENSTWYVDPDKPFMSVNYREGGSNTVRLDGFSMRDKIDNAQDVTSQANQANVQRYVNACTISLDSYRNNPQDLTQWLHNEFRRISGFDVDAIRQKLPQDRTEPEKQALIDYEEFKKEITDAMINDINYRDEIKYYEMAVLSENCYGDSKHEFISQTNYRLKQTEDFDANHPMKNLSEIIDLCNTSSGFHADIYYNEKTNEYTIAFEGSNFEFGKAYIEYLLPFSSKSTIKELWNDWVATNLLQAVGGIPQQYAYAAFIASQIPEGINVNITGHSLGGGLASVAGAISGKPTYTFNAEGVNQNIIDGFGLTETIEKRNYDIKAFQSKDDPLTSAQEGAIKLGTAIVLAPINPALSEELITDKIAAPAIGDKTQYTTAEGHPIVRLAKGHGIGGFIKRFSYDKEIFDGIRKEIYERGHGMEDQTQDRMQIILDDN